MLLRQALCCATAVLLGCEPADPVPEKLTPDSFEALRSPAELPLSATPAFGDERGGGIFVDLSGRSVRLRADGTQSSLESHPANVVVPGPALGAFPLGPYSALVATSKGLFVADNGWLIAPPWQSRISAEGLHSSTVGDDGVAWLAHDVGLLRLENGAVQELKVGGESVTGLTALAVGPALDGAAAVWFAQGEKLFIASQRTKSDYSVRESQVPAEQLKGGVLALAGIAASSSAAAEVWAITPTTLFRFSGSTWRRYDFGRPLKQLLAAGRVLWLAAGDALYRYDADAPGWHQASGLSTAPTLLAVDASGAAWVRDGDATVSVSPVLVPRVHGVFQNQRVYEPEVVLRAALPTASKPSELKYHFDDAAPVTVDVTKGQLGDGPMATTTFYALGGLDIDGHPKPLSLSALELGVRSLTVEATWPDSSTSQRVVYFEVTAAASESVSWDRDLKVLSNTRCGTCHQTGTMPELKTYEQWKMNAALIGQAVKDRRMPADGPLDPSTISLVQRWVTGGAQP